MNEDFLSDEMYMRRCLELASLGAGAVSPNPMVGAVIVKEGKIIGEGYHKKYGEAHAEVNAVNQAIEHGHANDIAKSTIYISLEPCTHFGKTPPCTDLIINHKISKVVIGCRDPFKEVDGKGIEKLQAAGVDIVSGVLESECKERNKRFFTFNILHRPYIILKWAQTKDKKIATLGSKRLLISKETTNKLVHKWRSEEDSILVGTNTIALDNPELTMRLWPGSSPIRLIIDMNLRLSNSFKVFDQNVKTIIFNKIKNEENKNLLFYQISEQVNIIHHIINALYQMKIQSVIVEGGAVLLQSFIDERLWDEARIITNTQLTIGDGLSGPQLLHSLQENSFILADDIISIYRPAIIQ